MKAVVFVFYHFALGIFALGIFVKVEGAQSIDNYPLVIKRKTKYNTFVQFAFGTIDSAEVVNWS